MICFWERQNKTKNQKNPNKKNLRKVSGKFCKCELYDFAAISWHTCQHVQEGVLEVQMYEMKAIIKVQKSPKLPYHQVRTWLNHNVKNSLYYCKG